MSQKFRRIQRAAMTLMELLIVVSILGLLAVIAIPKLVDAYERSRSGIQTYGVADVSRAVENYFGTYRKYPDGVDTLLSADSGVDSSTVYANLHPTVLPWLTASDAVPYSAFQNVGMSHCFMHVSTTASPGVLPSDSGQLRSHYGLGHSGGSEMVHFAVLNTSASGSQTVKDILLKDFNVNQNKDSSTDQATLDANWFVVLGLGPRNTMVGTIHQNAPLFESANPTKYYSRALLIFMVPKTANAITKARFIGAIGPDGRSLQDSLQDYNTGAVPH